MKRNIKLLIAILTLLFVTGISDAITVTVSPNPVRVNEVVKVDIRVTFPTRDTFCPIKVNFGDGSGWTDAGICSYTNICNLTTSHVYTTPGVYKIQVMPRNDCKGDPYPPNFVSVSLKVLCKHLDITSPATLMEATVGQHYTYQLQTIGGHGPIKYYLVSGLLPPGLVLTSSGLITGIPKTEGTYSFIIRAKDNCPLGAQSVEKSFSLNVKSLPISITLRVSPSSFRIPRGLASTQNVSYIFSATTTQQIKLYSEKGVFIANDRIIGDNNKPLIVNISKGVGNVSEVIFIPVAVVKRAEKFGTSRIIYKRNFTDNKNISLIAQVEIIVTTEAGAEFRITRLQLYFENKRPEITVKRNQPKLKAYADIRFTGSGLLQGYWEVDGRILSTINRHLVYGRTVTIETPRVPSLPTFETGTHILRFVITNPSQDVILPVAIYFVTTDEFKRMLSIRLLYPNDRAEIEYSPLTFKWEGLSGITTYLIEFITQGEKKPLFSAYIRKPEYRVPSFFLKNIFALKKIYSWKVKGFDTENNILAESPIYRFTFKQSSVYVPGQIIIVTKKHNIKKVEEIARKYHLILIESFDLKTLNLRVNLFFTKEDIFKVINEIQKNKDIFFVQPNYIFKTMIEPMSDMQKIVKVLKLEKIHKRYRGKGVTVAIIDTGIDNKHEELKERVQLTKNLINSPFKGEVHGTAVAGVIGASVNKIGIEGIAPEVKILALRACKQVSPMEPEGECYTISVAKAIDISIQRNAKVVNMSFGSPVFDKLITKLIDEGAKKGILFTSPVGNMPWQKKPFFPAIHPDVIAVAGVDDMGNFYPSAYIVSKADVYAPATNIFTTIPGDKYNFLSGTSMASATIAGILAVAIEKNGDIQNKLPNFKGDICTWVEELLNISICNR